MKAYTDLSQSHKLAEILPLESADMFYDGIQDLYKEKVYNIPINGSSITVRTGHIITKKDIKSNLLLPCWSLAALLDVINDDYYTTLYHDGVAWNITAIHHDNVKDKHNVYAYTPIDACVEMILKLHELNLL